MFDQRLRAHSYNPYSTAGAATTVEDLLTTPSDIHGQKFFYVSPTSRVGYTGFDIGSSNMLLGLTTSPIDAPAALILGFATQSFGVALNYSVAKVWMKDETDPSMKESVRITNPGDNIGIYFSVPLGSMTAYANASWLTYAPSYSVELSGSGTSGLVYDESEDHSALEFNLGVLGSAGSLNYDGYLNVIRTGGTITDSDGESAIDENTYLGVALGFNLGFSALQSSTARVIVGLNNSFSMAMFDEIDQLKSDNVMAFIMVPNILAEVSLFENWLAFAGAAQSLNIVTSDPDRENKTSGLTISHDDETRAFAGIRYQKPNWALEGMIAANMFNNPFGGFNGSAMFAEVGGFIYF